MKVKLNNNIFEVYMTFNLPAFKNRTTNERNAIENIFEEFFNDFNRLSLPLRSEGLKMSFLPRINISETDNKYCIEAELPGVEQKDVELKLDGNILTISGKTESNKENKDRNYFMRERHYGSFQRSLSLPNNVNEEEVNATFNNGILNIEIDKKHSSGAKKIEVKTK